MKERELYQIPIGVNYISDLSDFKLPDTPTLINKRVSCGFTDWLVSKDHGFIIILFPSSTLLECKSQRWIGNHLCIRNMAYDNTVEIDSLPGHYQSKSRVLSDSRTSRSHKKLELDSLKELRWNIRRYYNRLRKTGSCKILGTYESISLIRSALGKFINDFRIVVDDFQSVYEKKFVDPNYPLLSRLSDLTKVSLISSISPNYLNHLAPDGYNIIDFEWGDWKFLGANINVRVSHNPRLELDRVVCPYLSGNFPKMKYRIGDNIYERQSKELVIYVNNINDICSIIKRYKLSHHNTNVICSFSYKNSSRIKKRLGLYPKNLGGISTGIPTTNKMFTIISSGHDFGIDLYSNNARSIIYSTGSCSWKSDNDILFHAANILSRQRSLENPWKNSLDIIISHKRLSSLSKNFDTSNPLSNLFDRYSVSQPLRNLINNYLGYGDVVGQLKYLYSLDNNLSAAILNSVDPVVRQYILTLSRPDLSACCFQRSKLDKRIQELSRALKNQPRYLYLIYSFFESGKKYLNSAIKSKLLEFKNATSQLTNDVIHASDILKYFSARVALIIVNRRKYIRKKGYNLISPLNLPQIC